MILASFYHGSNFNFSTFVSTPFGCYLRTNISPCSLEIMRDGRKRRSIFYVFCSQQFSASMSEVIGWRLRTWPPVQIIHTNDSKQLLHLGRGFLFMAPIFGCFTWLSDFSHHIWKLYFQEHVYFFLHFHSVKKIWFMGIG